MFVDYPQTDGEVKKSDAIDASIICYDPKSIINWRVEKVGNENKFTLIVIEEEMTKIDPEDQFKTNQVKEWHVLELVDGVYTKSRWEKVTGIKVAEDAFVVIEDSISIPTKGDGSTWDTIPFTFIGSSNNDSDIDQSPTYDLATLNIGHYRNSADYEESVFVVGQPMYLLAGLTQGWVDEKLQRRIPGWIAKSCDASSWRQRFDFAACAKLNCVRGDGTQGRTDGRSRREDRREVRRTANG